MPPPVSATWAKRILCLGSWPSESKAQVEPFIPGVVDAIYGASSRATAGTFTPCIVAAAVAAGLVLFLKEAPARAPAAVSKSEGRRSDC